MNTLTKTYSKISYLALCALVPAQLMASQYVVNSNLDPAVGDPSACFSGSDPCTLRDALAAADLTAEMDQIVFDIQDTIYLSKSLSALHPVHMDGGDNTTIRVKQGYSITTLEDRPSFGDGEVSVIQPAYFSVRGGVKAMLELWGDGTIIENLSLDGSLTPLAGDLGVERIDYESNDSTDYVLYTVNSGESGTNTRWPIAGGIATLGSTTIRSNSLSHMGNNAITVNYGVAAHIIDNHVSGGAAGQRGYSADGISFFGSVYTVVSGNTVSGFRNGVTFFWSSGVTATGNEFSRNVRGLELDAVGNDYADVLIENNTMAHNLESGVYVNGSLGAQINANEVNHNASTGIQIKGSGEITISDNEVNHNGSGAFTDGGILISEGSGGVSVLSNATSHNKGFGMVISESYFNVLDDNSIMKNEGSGIVLFNGAQWNSVQNNRVKKNAIGVYTGADFDVLFPSENQLQGNDLRKNKVIDALDYDPACNDLWSNNKIGTSASASANCINP